MTDSPVGSIIASITEASDQFDWSNGDGIVVQWQDRLAVHSNQSGQIVFRRQRDWNEAGREEFIQSSITPNLRQQRSRLPSCRRLIERAPFKPSMKLMSSS